LHRAEAVNSMGSQKKLGNNLTLFIVADVLQYMSDDWENTDEYAQLYNWLDNESTPPVAPRPVKKKPKQSAKATEDVRKLDFCTDDAPERILTALEDRDFFKNPTGLMGLANFLFSKDNSTHPVWQSFRPYHANLLAYQIASGIGVGSITDVTMVRECYRIIVTIMQQSIKEVHQKKFENVTTNTVYHQWVAKETPGEMDNLSLLFRFLHEKDGDKQYYAVGKLPME